MRLALAQMQMNNNLETNLEKTMNFMRKAKNARADMIFFPEIQLSPFFPKYAAGNASQWLLNQEHEAVMSIRQLCRELGIFASPNLYLSIDGKNYDASLMIDSRGNIMGISKMVHIAQAENFYEQDYYSPSDDGFKVYRTPFGPVGIVICYDRHFPGSIQSCAEQGAKLVLIPTANLTCEPMELFEWEIRVQAYQNHLFAAMCNRVGPEDHLRFAGESLIAAPDGSLLLKAGETEDFLIADISL